jgi:hypothetical protein
MLWPFFYPLSHSYFHSFLGLGFSSTNQAAIAKPEALDFQVTI